MATKALYEMLLPGKNRDYARKAFPILVRQAEAGVPIQYKALSIEVGAPHWRNFGGVMGIITHDILLFSGNSGIEVPPIMALAVSEDGLPGDGYYEASNDFSKCWLGSPELLQKLGKEQRKIKFRSLYEEMCKFDKWDMILRELGLERLAPPVSRDQAETESTLGHYSDFYAPESEAHKQLKRYIARTPRVVGIKSFNGEGEEEHRFPSLDAIDVLFPGKGRDVIVEVKPLNASREELRRGLYQCMKYIALREAENRLGGRFSEVRVVLALGGTLPIEVRREANTLGIEVFENLAVLVVAGL